MGEGLMRKSNKQLEAIYAAKVRKLKKSYLAEHQDGDSPREAAEASGGNRAAQGGGVEKATGKEKVRKVIEAFFFKDGKFVVIFFWATIFSILIVACLVMKMCGVKYLSDTLILGLMGFVTAIIGLYNIDRTFKRKYESYKENSGEGA
jgi:hypothetical protein